MAIVPEMDDVNKPSSEDDQSDISAQSTTSNISQPTAAPATGGGQAVAGAAPKAGPSSSGNFQDFGKFKAANQNKLSALSNLATDTAKNNVNNTASAFANAGSAYKQGVEANKVDFNSGTTNADGSYNVDAYSKKLQDSANKVDTGETEGKLAGTQEYSALNAAEQQATGINSRAGTAAVLGNVQNGASASAANQDSLLLQSMGDYRQKANEISQNVKGITANQLAAQQESIRNAGTAVNADNASGRQKALDALKAERSGIDTKLASDAAAAEAERVSSTGKSALDARNNSVNAVRADINGKILEIMKTKGFGPEAVAEQNKLYDLLKLDDENLFKNYDSDITRAVNGYSAANAGNQITADNLYAKDAGLQSKVSALDALLNAGGQSGGQVYNAGAKDAVQSNSLDKLDELKKLILDQKIDPGKSIGGVPTTMFLPPTDRPITSRDFKAVPAPSAPAKTKEQIAAEQFAAFNKKLRN